MSTSADSIYRSIAMLAKVQYRYLVVSRYFDILVSNAHSSIPTIVSIPLIFRYLTSSPFDDVDAKPVARRNIVVDDDVVYGCYHYSASQPKLT